MNKVSGIILVIIVMIAIVVSVVLIIVKDEKKASEKVQAVAIGVTYNAAGVASDSPSLLYSYDGKTWKQTIGTSFNYNITSGLEPHYSGGGVAYGDEKWVAVGHNKDTNDNILYSVDGIEWKAASRRDGMSIFYNGDSNAGLNRGNAVAYSNKLQRWVAVGKDINNENILYSSDGITWDVAGIIGSGTSTFIGPSTLAGGYNVAYANDNWVAVGRAENNDSNIVISTNGISWTKSTLLNGTSAFVKTNGGGGKAIVYDFTDSIWYAGGEAEDEINLLSSLNGDNWQKVNATVTNGSSFLPKGCYSLAYSLDKNAFLATGVSGGTEEENLLFTDSTLQNWDITRMSNGISFPFSNNNINGNEVAYSSTLKLWLGAGGALGDNLGGALIYSNNGISWDVAKMSNGISFPYGDKKDSTGLAIATRD